MCCSAEPLGGGVWSGLGLDAPLFLSSWKQAVSRTATYLLIVLLDEALTGPPTRCCQFVLLTCLCRLPMRISQQPASQKLLGTLLSKPSAWEENNE